MRVYLVRHGQTAWNAEQRAQGHTDIPLDTNGREQARLLALAFDEDPIARVVSSDLQRAASTALPLAERHAITLEQRHDLRERTFGDWEGKPFEFIAKSFIEQELVIGVPRQEIRPPNGESQLDVWNRLEDILAELQESHEPTVVVGHGGTCALLLARLIGGTLITSRAFRFDNGGITTVSRRPDGGFQLIRYNDVSHLRQPSLSGSVDGTIR